MQELKVGWPPQWAAQRPALQFCMLWSPSAGAFQGGCHCLGLGAKLEKCPCPCLPSVQDLVGRTGSPMMVGLPLSLLCTQCWCGAGPHSS